MTEQYESLLTKMPLFQGVTAYGASLLLQRGAVKEHAAGEQLCREGDAADTVLLILTGKLQAYIERDGVEMIVSEFAPGTILGDVGVLCGIPRAFSVRASEPAVALYWTASAYRSLLLTNPFLSHRMFGATMRMLIEHEKSLLESVIRSHNAGTTGDPVAEPPTPSATG